MVETLTIETVTYDSTSAGTPITLTDDAFGLVHAINDLANAVRILTARLT